MLEYGPATPTGLRGVPCLATMRASLAGSAGWSSGRTQRTGIGLPSPAVWLSSCRVVGCPYLGCGR